MGGLRREKKWRPDRTDAPEEWLTGRGVPTPGGALGGWDQGE